MSKSLLYRTASLFLFVLLVGIVATASARTGQDRSSRTAQLQVLSLNHNQQQSLILWKEDEKGDKNGKDDDKDYPPSPTPEPATILSFGAALLIGGGVLYSRRLRSNRK